MPTPRLEAKPSLRRPTISIPAALDLNGGDDFDIHHWRRADTGYTSLRDILTSSSAAGGLLSPSASAAPAAGEIQIRNRLVKQAAYAYAYLQPTPSSLESSDRRRRRRRRRGPIRRLLAVLSCGLAGSCFDFVGRFFQSIRR